MLKKYLALVTFSHTIFAMPFAMIGLALGLRQVHINQLEFPVGKTIVLVIACMVFARSAAMGFNRLIDSDFDLKNNRTKNREIPAGKISKKQALIFVVLMSLGFVVSTYFINSLCFYLSPIALFVILTYSYTKRFTSLCHLGLGLGLALAPVGAYLAVTAEINAGIIYLGIAVMLWTSGFDVVYALQDEDFDRSQNLKSIPVWLGAINSNRLSIGLHVLCALFLAMFGIYFFDISQYIFWIGYFIFVSFLYYQHTIISLDQLTNINKQYMTTNGIASLVFGIITIISIIIL